MQESLVSKSDISKLLKIYKKYSAEDIKSFINKNEFNNLDHSEIKTIEKIIKITSNPIEFILNINDTYAIQESLTQMASGMGTALLTTLVGLVSSVLIKSQLVMVESYVKVQ